MVESDTVEMRTHTVEMRSDTVVMRTHTVEMRSDTVVMRSDTVVMSKIEFTGLIWAEVKQLWDLGFDDYIHDMWNLLDFTTNALYIATITLKAVAYIKVSICLLHCEREGGRA